MAPSSNTLQSIFSIIEISISVDVSVNELSLASINILDSIGNEFFLSTIPWRWDKVLKKLERNILNFIIKHMLKKIKNLSVFLIIPNLH